MSRCTACNAELDDWETSVKTQEGEYLDLCSICLDEIEVDYISQEDLRSSVYISPEIFGDKDWLDD